MCCLLATFPLLARRLADMRHPCPPCIPLPAQTHTGIAAQKTSLPLSMLFSPHARRPADESLLCYVACWQRFLPLHATWRTHAFTLARHAFSLPAQTHTGVVIQKISLPLLILFSPRASPGRRISLLCCLLATFPSHARRPADARVHPRSPCILPSRANAHGYRDSENKSPAFNPVFSPRVSRQTNLSIMLLVGNVFSPCTPPCGRNGLHLTLT